MIAAFDELYGSNRQIREMAIAREDLRSAQGANVEQRRLLEVLLKYGDKIGAGSVSDAIGIDRDRWAALEDEISVRYRRMTAEYVRKFATAIVTLSGLPDDLRDRISEIALRAEFPSEEPVIAADAAVDITGDDSPSSETNQDEDTVN
jgi:hypothetical protein